MKSIPAGDAGKGLRKLKEEGQTELVNKMGYMKTGGAKSAMETGSYKYGGSCGKVYTYNRDIKSLI